jgi:hypothetical protein
MKSTCGLQAGIQRLCNIFGADFKLKWLDANLNLQPRPWAVAKLDGATGAT